MNSKDFFELGLFSVGILWADKSKGMREFKVAKQQAKNSLKNLKIRGSYIDVIEKRYSVSGNINDKLKKVIEGLDFIDVKLKPKIQKKYGDSQAISVFYTGVNLANLIFACGLLDNSWLVPERHNDIQFLTGYVENLKKSLQSIGNPDISNPFLERIQNALSNTSEITYLLKVPKDGMDYALELGVWIQNNIIIEEKGSVIWKIVLGVIAIAGGIWTIIQILEYLKARR